jgi:hypothetical protein
MHYTEIGLINCNTKVLLDSITKISYNKVSLTQVTLK